MRKLGLDEWFEERMKVIGRLNNGQKIWTDGEGFIFFENNDGKFDYTSGQTIASNRLDYRYTHGGNLYKEACEIYWKTTKAD